MTLLEWRKEFETGIADVDFEHRELIGLINQLHNQLAAETSAEKISDFLGEIFARIAAHFALEESMMRKHGYDQYLDHKSDHERLLDEIRDIMDAFEQGTFDTYQDKLGTTIRDWFINHFKSSDARLHLMLGI